MRIWSPARNAAQRLLVADMHERARGVPCERNAVFAAGLRGADKAGALAQSGVDASWYLTVSVDGVLAEMAARNLIPRVPGLAPMEGADLAHTEAQYLAKRLLLRALADGRNLICDMTMASRETAGSWLNVLAGAGYTTSAVFVEISIEESVRRSDAMHRNGHEEYLSGRGFGGRYVPAEAIRALTDTPATAARSAVDAAPGADGAASHADARREGVVIRLLDLYWRGELTLDEMAGELGTRPWPENPPACPQAVKAAAPAVDDPEPYVPGSFDEIVRACDLGLLSDDEYAAIALASVHQSVDAA